MNPHAQLSSRPQLSFPSRSVHILIADDDPEDRMLISDALTESGLDNPFHFVENGEEVMDFLYHRNGYEDDLRYPRPGLILLDLNMPRKDGREVLREIKAHPDLRRIPIIVLTTSKAEEDVIRSYNLGVNSFITKPVSFDQLVTVIGVLGKYWLEIVELPKS